MGSFVDAVKYDNDYAQSRWVVEKMIVNTINEHHIPTIYRPGTAFCHSKAGIGNFKWLREPFDMYR